MDPTIKAKKVHSVFQNIAEGYDKANDRISLGLQRSWKKLLTDHLLQFLPGNGRFLDVCCGTGDIAITVAARRPDVTVEGLDFSDRMLEVAGNRIRACKAKLSNITLTEGDAMKLPYEDNSFDAAAISFGLRNTGNYAQVLTEMYRVVREDGYIYCLDSFVPESPLVKPFYRFYFSEIMPLIGGGRTNRNDYMWLDQSTQEFLKKAELMELFKAAGCTQITTNSKMFGACVLTIGRVSNTKGGKHE